MVIKSAVSSSFKVSSAFISCLFVVVVVVVCLVLRGGGLHTLLYTVYRGPM